MFKRTILYVSKNFSKMLSTLITFIVMLAMLSSLVYVFLTVSSKTSKEKVQRHNYIVDEGWMMDQMYGLEEEGEEEVDDVELEKKSYRDIYDKLITLDGLEAYKIDLGYFNSLMIVPEETDGQSSEELLNQFFESEVIISLANDEKEIDFQTGTLNLEYGSFGGDGVIVSDEFLQEQNLQLGDKLEFTNRDFIEFGEFDDGISFSYTIELEIDGVYSGKPNRDYGAAQFYMSTDGYDKLAQNFENEVNEMNAGGDYYGSPNPYDFTRVLAQYDNEESIKELDEFVSGEYGEGLLIVDSAKELEKSAKPIDKFAKLTAILVIVMIVTSILGVYLNMFLKLEKRKSEFIALLGFGVKSFKLSLQVFLEQFIFLIISLPIVYLIINASIGFIIELIKKYYIVAIQKVMMETDESMFYGMRYASLNTEEVVDFIGANKIVVVLVCFAIMTLILLILSFVEMARRYMKIERV